MLPAAAILLLVLAEPAAAPTATAAALPASACSLLTGEELAAAQGSELVEAAPMTAVRDGLAVSRCYFRTRDLARSVSLELTRLEARDGEALLWLSLVSTQADGQATVNLRAPIVINPRSMRGIQLVSSDAAYALDHPLLAA